jgi:hypothetical protein
MAEPYADLGITQKQDGDYWDIVVPDLDANTDYAVQFAWVYSDKAKGNSPYSDFFEFTTPAPVRTCPINVEATWDQNTADLKVIWEKPFLTDGVTRDNRIKLFQLTLTANGLDVFVPIAVKFDVNNYSYTLSQQNNMANFGGTFQGTIVGKITSIYGDGSSDDCLFTIPTYVDPVCTGSIADNKWSVTSIDNGILVSWNDDLTKAATYRETRVYVSETNSPYNWVLRYTGFGPASITLDTFADVYVKLNHLSDSNCLSLDSSVKTGKAFDTIEFDNTPPDPVINPSAAWDVNRDLIVSFTMPADSKKLPSYVKVHLTYNAETEYFEKTVNSTIANALTSVKITRNEIIDGFGANPTSFTSGYVTDLDIYRNENTTQVNIANLATAIRPNPLNGILTTINVSSTANGYIVSSNLHSKATGIDIYQSSLENGTYTLIASSISSPVIIYDEDNAGNSVWVKAKWTCEDGDANMSAPQEVQILDVGALSLIENPVKIKTDGSIFAGTLDANDEPVLAQARMVINKRGLFLYDDNDENGIGPTTQIIGKWDSQNSLAPATFITKKAKIANWIISENKFENVLTSSTKTYTGLSPNGTYAFWAGAGAAGGYSEDINNDAKFSVTHSGNVIARNIKILGGELEIGSNVTIDTEGKIIAKEVDLSGEIKAASGIIGNVEIGGTINGVAYNGQMLISTGEGSKVEIGKYTSGDIKNPAIGFSGIQITGSNQKYVQLDPVNGIIANKGTIAGWTIDNNSINKSGNVGLYAPNNPEANDIMIWAGTSRLGSPGPNFSVTYSGALTANEATIKGSIEAREGYFGTYDTTTKTITDGWKINGKFLQSFSSAFSDVKVKLDGLQGTIAGGNIVGSNVFFMDPDTWYTIYSDSGSGNPGNVDYISSTGNFRLAGGKLTYDGNSFNVQTDLIASNIFLGSASSFSSDYILGKDTTIGNTEKDAGSFRLANGMLSYDSSSGQLTLNPSRLSISKFKIYLNAVANGDGTAGDKTLVQDADTGELTLGRAFFYAGNQYPDGRTNRSEFAGGDQGSGAFDVGDIILSRKA